MAPSSKGRPHMFELTLQAVYSGVLTGGYYALVALGLALVFGTMKIINLAHGELVLLSAYIAYTAESQFGLNPIAAIPFALVVVGIVAIVVYLLVGRIKRDRELNSLILTFGVGIILTNFVLLVWSADIHSTTTTWFQEAVVVGDILYSSRSEVLFFLISIALVFATWWWLTRTWYGRAIRAVSSNRDAAMLMGVNPRQTEILSFIVAGVLASVAGIAIYTGQVIQPSLGLALTIKAFIITVLAGMGSIPGVLLGAVLIGVIEALTVTYWSSALQEFTGMVLFLVVLLVRPQGLFGFGARRG
jgi:branched-chain amino acid transport system permease protein